MSTKIFNPLTGKNSPGERFRFQLRLIAHNTLYLPYEMKSIPEIRRLLEGASPLDVFGCSDLPSARACFHLLRMKHDFPYWAAINYLVSDKDAPREKVPLILNTHQRFLIDTFIRREKAGLPGKYFVTKSTPQCGLTTCIQAYILWNQLHRHPRHSVTVTPDINCNFRLKYALSENLGKKVTPDGVDLDADIHAAFLQQYESYMLQGCHAAYVHMADMLKWYDPSADSSRLIFRETSNGWDKNPHALLIFEGDTTVRGGFHPENYRDYFVKEPIRIGQISLFFTSPYFVSWYVMLTDPRMSSDYCLINLDQATVLES